MIKKILSLILLLIAGRTICVPILGGDIQYTYQGNGVYKITAKMYRDCRGLPFTSILGTAYAGSSGSQSCGTQTLTFTRVAINNVSQFCSTATNPCKLTNQADGEGVEEHIYETTLDVTKTPYSTWIANGCCDLTFAAGLCCRNPASNSMGGDNLWVKCSMNVCNLSKTKFNYNSSPVFTNIPIVYACCSSPYIYNQGSIDTTDFDSISYKMVSGLTSLPNGTGTYNSPYSAKYPMKPYCIPTTSVSCTPKPTAKPPIGFHLDTSNGNLTFTPIKCDELGFVVIEVNEYRKDTSGNWVIVGNSRRDMQIVVKDNCGYNNSPTVSGSFSNKVFEGDKICFTVKSADETYTPHQTTPDTTLLTWNQGIPSTNCTFTVTNPSAREKEAEFCWQTKVGDAKDVAYYFTATANDQHCSRPSLSTRAFRIKVEPKATASLVDKGVLIKEMFVIQPNPNDGKFAVILRDKTIAVDKILLLDLTGKTIESISKPIDLSTGVEINSTKLSAGIYFLQLQSENKVYRQKFVVAN